MGAETSSGTPQLAPRMHRDGRRGAKGSWILAQHSAEGYRMTMSTQRRVFATGFASLCLASASLVSAPPPAEAYAWLGCRFASTSVKWQDATTTSGYSSASLAALNSWGSTSIPVSFSKVTSGANLRVANGNFGNVGSDGIMKGPGTGTNAPSCSNGVWTQTAEAWLNNYYTDSYVANKRRSVMAHEVGHALGLAHVDSGSACGSVTLMHPATYNRYDVCGIVNPASDDIAGVRARY